MATLSILNPTLADIAKRKDPNGKIDTIVELLTETNEILEDMTFVEANGETSHKTTIRSGLPSATWRKLNYGVQPSKSTTVQVVEPTKYAILIPFQFNTQQTYILEFGDQTMRVIKDGGYVLDTGVVVSDISQGSVCTVTTSTAHGYVTDDWVFISSVEGMVELKPDYYAVTYLSPTTFWIRDLDGAYKLGEESGKELPPNAPPWKRHPDTLAHSLIDFAVATSDVSLLVEKILS